MSIATKKTQAPHGLHWIRPYIMKHKSMQTEIFGEHQEIIQQGSYFQQLTKN